MDRPLPAFIKLLFPLVIGVSGFLIFLVQPMMGKIILPSFGGTAAVWSSCILFFQSVLLFGYCYAFLLTRLALIRQLFLHIAVVLAAIIFIPSKIPIELLDSSASPTLKIIFFLGATVGFPYVMLSTTSTVAQHWFGAVRGNSDPTFLYAISNALSFAGLLSYPIYLERLVSTDQQLLWWGRGFAVYLVLILLLCAALLRLQWHRPAVGETTSKKPAARFGSIAIRPALGALALSFLGAVLLLSTTSVATTAAPSVPLLWAIPLALYLLSFVIAFSGKRAPAMPLTLVAAGCFFGYYALSLIKDEHLAAYVFTGRILLLSVQLFASCLVVHTRMADLRPGTNDVGAYYLLTTLGGALGGAVVVFAVPQVFTDYWEFELALLAALMVGLSKVWRRVRIGAGPLWSYVAAGTAGAAFLGAALLLHEEPGSIIRKVRNFYGVIKIVYLENDEGEDDGDPEPTVALFQSNVNQGEQKIKNSLSRELSCDFGPQSGIGLAFSQHPKRIAQGADAPLRIGVLGMGVGMLSVYGKPADTIRYYEINPAVVAAANSDFTFLKEARSKVDIVLGDGRLMLAKDARDGLPRFDILVLDAFSGGSPPVHLLTREAFDLYFSMIEPDGLLLGNFEVEILNVAPLLRGQARAADVQARWFQSLRIKDCDWPGVVSWAAMTKHAAYFEHPAVKSWVSPWPDDSSTALIWTDARSDLLSIIDW
jgi:hypothetical protein